MPPVTNFKRQPQRTAARVAFDGAASPVDGSKRTREVDLAMVRQICVICAKTVSVQPSLDDVDLRRIRHAIAFCLPLLYPHQAGPGED
jgi:hypothetical protein